ncbi:PREDICTED: annexin-like protein RJ4 [Populus euphratica]|uniref:Annexin-like protein RJ4 n=1 Tax=Populus euphratica TaxID=75702 RepID=A0AAJ6SVZ2_POPEU|nr:PREDICTED: annexin-like protein RJ4 [Populus euphratica]
MIILLLLVELVTAFRYEGDEINARLANSEADIIHDAIKVKEFNHEEVIRILTTRSKAQLTETFNRYGDDHGSSITKALLDEPAEEFKADLRTAIRC